MSEDLTQQLQASVDAVEQRKAQAIERVSVTPMQLIQAAMNQNLDVAMLEKLMELQLRWEANEAKKAFVAAMNAFKSDTPEISKNRKADFPGKSGTDVSYQYATLDNVCDQITPALSKHGISHRWKVEQQDGRIRVTCILTHGFGHSEETTLESKADMTGAKNEIQAIGSAISYLERYSLLAATGIAVKGTDTDGVTLTPQLEQALKAIREAPDLSALKKVSTQPIQEYMKANDLPAARALIEARDERKKELLKDESA